MEFQNALVALKKGFKVQRESGKNRINAVCLFIKKGKLYAKQTHEMSEHKVKEVLSLSVAQLLADDWTTKGIK